MIKHIAYSILIMNCINSYAMEWDLAAAIEGNPGTHPSATMDDIPTNVIEDNNTVLHPDQFMKSHGISCNEEFTSFAVRKDKEWIATERAIHQNDSESVKKIVEFFSTQPQVQKHYYEMQQKMEYKTPLFFLLQFLVPTSSTYVSLINIATTIIQHKAWINCIYEGTTFLDEMVLNDKWVNAHYISKRGHISEKDQPRLISLLLENGAARPCILQKKQPNGNNGINLYHLIDTNNKDALSTLLTINPFVIQMCQHFSNDFEGKEDTPLHYALRHKKNEIAKLLIEKCPFWINIANNNGEKPTDLATEDMLEMLYQRGAEQTLC